MTGCALLLGTGFGLALWVHAAAWAQAPTPPLTAASAPPAVTSAPPATDGTPAAPLPVEALASPPPVQPASAVVFAPVLTLSEPAAASVMQAPWFDQPLGPDPGAWRFSAALDTAGASDQAAALRRVLLRRHLAQLLAEPTEPALTVRQAIEMGASRRTPDADPELRARWIEVMNRHLNVVVPAAALPLPPELDADAARLRELAPGLWSLHAGDGTLRGRVWWLLLHNQSPLPLALAEFRVRAPAGPVSTAFECSLPRYAEGQLALPGRDTAYLCRANAGAGTAPAWTELARLLRSGAVLPVQIEPLDLSDATPVLRVFLRLEGPHKQAGGALAAQLRSTAPLQAAARAGVARPAGVATAPTAASDRINHWTLGLLALAALGVYALLNSLGGRRAAMLGSAGLLMALALAAAFKGLPAGWSPLPQVDLQNPRGMLLPVLLAVATPVLATLALAVCHEVLFGERIGILRSLGRVVADGMVGDLVDRLFQRGRY